MVMAGPVASLRLKLGISRLSDQRKKTGGGGRNQGKESK